ncbi:MAG: helix-turn-helix transcriptional regulator, partial [Oscillospiraceae bacterium]|nr:helix-turn-helix transcriptional regulator [Oscillospiraceae bacterium]
MNDFPRILALLRNERKISQKKAAQDLGIAQALLSHYERGKRECGLAFLVKAADYYGVSTDYLLGRTATTDGTQIARDELMSLDEI